MAKTTRTGKGKSPTTNLKDTRVETRELPPDLGKMLMDRLQTKLKEMGIPAEVVDTSRRQYEQQRALLQRKGIKPGLKINNMQYMTLHPSMVRPNVRFGCAIVFNIDGTTGFDNLDTITRSPMDAYEALMRRLNQMPDGTVSQCGLLAYEV